MRIFGTLAKAMNALIPVITRLCPNVSLRCTLACKLARGLEGDALTGDCSLDREKAMFIQLSFTVGPTASIAFS